MADEITTPAAASVPSSRKHVVILALVAAALAVAIVVVAALQARSARSLQTAADGLRQQLERLRQDTEAKDRLLTDLTAKTQADVAKIAEGAQTFAAADARLHAEIGSLRQDIANVRVKAGLPAPLPGQPEAEAELGDAIQKDIAGKLACLGERIEKLKTEVVLKETRILQDQITDTKGRIGRAEKDVSVLGKALNEADIPSLKAKVQEVDREVVQAEADVKALSKASEAFKAQVTGFFQEVFYNDPWSKYTPETPAVRK
jgi:predicted  nucleic acid-binding Zn-ribbon protein